MQNEIVKTFNSERFGNVRVVEREEEPWFVAMDVCKALEIKNGPDACKRLDDDEKMTIDLTDSHFGVRGGAQKLTIVNEPGLYSLVLSSRKPEAKEFKRWIVHEVIPSIRKHGAYITPAKIEEILADPDIIINLATTLKEERAKRKELESVVEEQKPLVEFANKVANTDKLISMGKMSKLLKDEHIDIGRNRLFKYLRDNKILTKKNLPYQRYVNSGYFQVKETSNSNGVFLTTYITGKGQMYLVKLARKLTNV